MRLRPWWAWPSLLGLDAPAVAVAWLWALGAGLEPRPGPGATFVVAASVWLVYAADRMLDARTLRLQGTTPAGAGAPKPTRRHRFVHGSGRALGWLWLVVLAADMLVAASVMAPATLATGSVVIMVAAATMIPGLRSRRIGVAVRAGLIGAAFAGGVAVGLDPSRLAFGTLASLAAFAAICSANVLCVGVWQRHLDDGVRAPSLPPGRPIAVALGASATAAALGFVAGAPAAACAAVSGGMLLALHMARGRLGSELASVLADVALVLPLVILI